MPSGTFRHDERNAVIVGLLFGKYFPSKAASGSHDFLRVSVIYLQYGRPSARLDSYFREAEL